VTAAVLDGGPQFSVAPDPDGRHLTIDNRHTAPGTYAYTVTVSANGTSYTSPDRAADAARTGAQDAAAELPPRVQNDT